MIIMFFGSVRREIFIASLTQSGAAKLTSSPIRDKQSIVLTFVSFFDKRLRSLFKVPDISKVVRGGYDNAIVDNILSSPSNLHLIIIRSVPSDWINLIDDISVAM